MFSYPRFLEELVNQEWERGQRHYEDWAIKVSDADSYESYMEEINSVREVYRNEFILSGHILDVGGHHGRLRHFVPEGATYLSVDPFGGVFEGLEKWYNLLRAFPCLKQPCNFLQARAQYLPLKSDSFDYVHMRSVLDHFSDPLLALYEARRVLHPGGGLLILVHVTGGKSSIVEGSGLAHLLSRLKKKIRDEGAGLTARAVAKRMLGRSDHDEHVWHPTHSGLIELLRVTHFEVEKEHWVKPPNDHVVCIMARKQ